MFNLILFMELIISTLNIRGTNDSMKRQQISRWMYQSKIDILASQETFVSDSLQSWPEFRKCDIFHSAGTNHARGISVIVTKRPGLVCTCHDSDPLGRYIILSVQCDKAAFHLTAIYAPVMQKGRSTFFSMISKIVAHHHCPILCGDFNCVMDSVLDRHSGSRVTSCTTSVVAIHKLVNDLGLDNVYRNRHPSTPGYTWMQAHNNVAERLDMFLVAKQLSHLVTEVDHHVSLFSDHHSVRLSLQCQDGSEGRGRSYWKFNLAFLSEDSFRTQFVFLGVLATPEKSVF